MDPINQIFTAIKICFFLGLFSVVVLLLSSCSRFQTQYHYKMPSYWPARRCIYRCQRDESLCFMDCSSREMVCHRDAQYAAWPQFRAYIKNQERQRLSIVQNIDYFADYSGCTDKCRCQYNYQRCFLSCGGEMFTTENCVMNCGHWKISKNMSGEV